MASDDIEKTANAEPEQPEVSEELKYMVDSGNADMKSNPNSLGWGFRQQIKLDHWNPENEEYWEVRSIKTILDKDFSYDSIIQYLILPNRPLPFEPLFSSSSCVLFFTNHDSPKESSLPRGT